jgi:hypothetical protein
MSHRWPFEAVVREVVAQLAAERYVDLERRTGGVRLSAGELDAAVRQYGRRLIEPPHPDDLLLDVAPIGDATPPRWSVNVELWTAEEGRSDLTLELTVCAEPSGGYAVEIDDLHVL